MPKAKKSPIRKIEFGQPGCWNCEHMNPYYSDHWYTVCMIRNDRLYGGKLILDDVEKHSCDEYKKGK